ncbi:MAG: 3'(2'),5'-bisphosphate nucleotidase [Syntrophobacterales bacterium]|nr:MAG: 3'(2'),5'-bisphosphate nucleotidase [Syntrophobacterales bacterium]
MPHEKEKEVVIRALIAASNLCMSIQNDLIGKHSIQKEDRSPVTVADYGSQAVICKILSDAFPDDPIVAEEDSKELSKPGHAEILSQVTHYVSASSSRVSSGEVCRWIDLGTGSISRRYWTLDPIDGTKGFLRGDQYAIALALIEEGTVRVGALACPNIILDVHGGEKSRGGLFVAARGQGTVQFGISGNSGRKIRIANINSPSQALFTESLEPGHSHHHLQLKLAKKLGISRPPLRMDSQAKYAILARGEASIYVRIPSPQTPNYREKIWDHAAGSILVEEAGGKVTDALDRALDFTCGKKLENNYGIIATNGWLHRTVVDALGPLLP